MRYSRHITISTYAIICVAVSLIDVGQCGKLEKWIDPNLHGSIEPSALKSASRNPKLFFGTTTTVTSTLSTTTACYTTAGTISTSCSGKRKRSISDDPIKGLENAKDIMPSSGLREAKNYQYADETKESGEGVSRKNSKLMDLNKVMSEGKESALEPRFLGFYWYTSTVTSTATSFTSTTTFSLTVCTPAGSFSYAACG